MFYVYESCVTWDSGIICVAWVCLRACVCVCVRKRATCHIHQETRKWEESDAYVLDVRERRTNEKDIQMLVCLYMYMYMCVCVGVYIVLYEVDFIVRDIFLYTSWTLDFRVRDMYIIHFSFPEILIIELEGI